MGKRGPKPGTTYRKGIDFTERLRIHTDRQLVAAQHFNERLDRLLADIDSRVYPAAQIDPRAVRQLFRDLEKVQDAVIGGIEDYLTRPAPWRGGTGSGSDRIGGAAPSPVDAEGTPDAQDDPLDSGEYDDAAATEETEDREPPMPPLRRGEVV